MSLPGQEALPISGTPQRLYRASPTRLTTYLDCPRMYRMAYLDRPAPPRRPQRAHTSVGLSTHNVLRDFWDLPQRQRTPAGVTDLVRASWIDVGFKDAGQSGRWQQRVATEVVDYLRGVDRDRQPLGVERTVGLKTGRITLSGRIDRLDDRDGELVVVDYKTSRRGLHPDAARTSLALAMYAVAATRMFHRPCARVELHHVPTGTVVAHEHTATSLDRKVQEADSVALDLRRADAAYAERGPGAPQLAPRPSPLCRWCDFRAHCPEGQVMGPEHSSWAALEPGE